MSDLNENRKVETPQQQEQAAPVSWKTKLADYLRKEPRDLPPMPKASRKRLGEFSEGTDEITRLGYRVPFVDSLRGLSIIAMVLYHFAYDVCTFGFFEGTGFNRFIGSIFYSESMEYWLFGFQMLFVFVSGISCNYSRNNFRRALKLFFAAMIITIGSAIFFGPSGAIYFGILHFLCVAALIYAVCHKYCDFLFERVNLAVYLFLFVVFVILTSRYQFEPLYLNLFGLRLEVPYFITGFTPYGFTGPDFFGIFPWILLYFCGVVFGRYMKQGVIPDNWYKFRIPGLDFVGRNTLLIYIVHQPILYGLLYLLDLVL